MDVELLNWIANNGFAVAVAVYSLTRLEKAMKENTAATNEMRSMLTLIMKGEKTV